MNSVPQLLALLPEGGWPRLMCDALWQTTLIAGLGWFIARLFIRAAAARAWVLLLTLSACAIVPLASAASRSAGWTFLVSADRVVTNETSLPMPTDSIAPPTFGAAGAIALDDSTRTGNGSNADGVGSVFSETVPPSPIPVAEKHSRPLEAGTHASAASAAAFTFEEPNRVTWYEVAGGIWLAALILLALRLALSTLAVWRILHRATPCDDAALIAAANEASRRMGLSRVPTILTSAMIESPMVLALGRPRLIVPRLPSDEQTAADIDWTAAFTHELAHAARGDGWSRLLVELIAIALPLQPLVWLLRRDYHVACEEACDDWAVSAGSDPVELAATLTAWLGRRVPAPAVNAIGMSSTKSRVLRLLAMRGKPSARLPRIWRWASVPAMAVLISGLALAQNISEKNEHSTDKAVEASQDKDTEPTPAVSPTVDPRDTADAPADSPTPAKSDASALDVLAETIKRDKQRLAAFQQALELQRQAVKAPDRDPSVRRLQETLDVIQREIAERRKLYEEQAAKTEAPDASSDSRQLPPYIIEPPDILLIDVIRLNPKEPTSIAPFDKVQIEVEGTGIDLPIRGTFQVDSSGDVVLGPAYGTVRIQDLTRRQAQAAVEKHLREVLAHPAVALTIDESRVLKGIAGRHLVAPDGTVNLGTYGSVRVTGMTIGEARAAIEKHLRQYFESPMIAVDVHAYNSKVYYVIRNGRGDNIQRFPITGNDTVLDAIANIGGTGGFSNVKIWVSRPSADGKDETLDVTWEKLLKGGSAANVRLQPGDRVFITGEGKTEPAKPNYGEIP